MKTVKKLLFVVFVFILLFVSLSIISFAKDTDYLSGFYDTLGVDSDYTSKIGFDSLIDELVSGLSSHKTAIAEFALYLIGGVILLVLASLFTGNKYIQASASFLVMLGAFKILWQATLEIAAALEKTANLFSALIPILSAVTLAGGGASSAATEAVTMSLTLNLVLGIFVPMLLPMSALILAYATVSPFDTAASFKRTRSAFMSLIAIATALFLGIISLSSVISIGKDNAMVRAAKYSVSGLIPIVGGAVSASLSTLGAGISYVKSIIGATSVYAIAIIALSPLVLLLIYRLLLSLATSLAERLSSGAPAFLAMTAALDGVIAVYALSVVTIIFEVILFMKSGVFVS